MADESLQVAHVPRQVILGSSPRAVNPVSQMEVVVASAYSTSLRNSLPSFSAVRPCRPFTADDRDAHWPEKPFPPLPLLLLPLCSIVLLYWSAFLVGVSYHVKWLQFRGKRNDVLGW